MIFYLKLTHTTYSLHNKNWKQQLYNMIMGPDQFSYSGQPLPRFAINAVDSVCANTGAISIPYSYHPMGCFMMAPIRTESDQDRRLNVLWEVQVRGWKTANFQTPGWC